MSLVRTFLSLSFLAATAGAVAGLAVAIAAVDRYSRDLPDHLALATYVPRTGSEMLAADGTLIGRKVEQRRTVVPYAKIPPLVRQAFVSAEDQNYFSHPGVDWAATARAALSHVAKGAKGGGSGITQQVAKNLLVGNEKSFERKIREALLALRMDRDLGKERVLEIYLNEIFLGQGAYGVAEAAETYFGKPLDQLDAAEAATLAGLPKAPSTDNPVRSPSRAKVRRDYVLGRMAEDGAITPAQAAALVQQPVHVVPRRGRDPEQDGGGYFEDDAWKELLAQLGPDALSKQDWVVKSTLRPKLQSAAQSALRAGIVKADRGAGWRGPLAKVRLPVDWNDPLLETPAGAGDWTVGVVESVSAGEAVVAIGPAERLRLAADAWRWTGRSRATDLVSRGDVVLVDNTGPRPELVQMPEVEGAMVAIDPRNGDVLALVGGFSHERSVFDRASQAKRQPGSSFKPIVYSTALMLGYDATSPILDAPIVLEQGAGMEDWRPNDAKSAGKGGLITVRRALEISRNMATVRLLWDIGLDDVQAMARRFGLLADRDKMTYALALGAGEVTPLQLAAAYAAFANGGKVPKPRFVSGAAAKAGQETRDFQPSAIDEPIDAVAASQMASILRGVVERGTAASAFKGFAKPLSGKTGTTNSGRDVWFVGFASDIVVAVWIGRDDNKPLPDGAAGGKYSAPVARDFLERAGSEIALTEVTPAPDAVVVTSDPETGLPTRGKGIPEILRKAPDEGTLAGNARPSPAKAQASRRQGAPAAPLDIRPPAPLPAPLEIITDD